MFENKHFNLIKKEMSHLTFKEISDLIFDKWKFHLPEDERKTYFTMAKQAEEDYYQEHEHVMS